MSFNDESLWFRAVRSRVFLDPLMKINDFDYKAWGHEIVSFANMSNGKEVLHEENQDKGKTHL